MQEHIKRLAQEAHDAGAKAGGWAREWKHMGEGQRREWEAVALAVAQSVARECALICKSRNMGDGSREDQEAMRCHDAVRARFGLER
jgi:hypothetical protein